MKKRYLLYKGNIFVYEDGVYQLMELKAIQRLHRVHIMEMFSKYGKELRLQGIQKDPPSISETITHSVYGAFSSLIPQITETPPCMDGKPTNNLLVMQNKIFDLDNYTERDYTPEFFSLSKLPYAYDPKATCPKWDKALDDYFKTDPDQVLQLDELMGYALVPGNPWELIAALCGASRGGKGLTAEIFGGLLGKENICAIGTDKLGSPFALYGAFGKLLIRVPDVPITGLTPCMTGMMNDIVGGETLNIEGKNSNAFFDVLTGKILLTSNFLRYCDPTNSFNNRLRVVRYTKSYLVKGERGYVQGQDQDAGLKSYIITNELPGIFNRALAGLKRFRTNKKFTEPASSRRLKDNMLAQGSPVTLFVEDALILKEGTQELCSDTFTVYGKWCVKMGYGKEIYDIQSTFGGLLQACCPSVERVRESTDGNRKYYYTGIEIKTEFKPEFKGT